MAAERFWLSGWGVEGVKAVGKVLLFGEDGRVGDGKETGREGLRRGQIGHYHKYTLLYLEVRDRWRFQADCEG